MFSGLFVVWEEGAMLFHAVLSLRQEVMCIYCNCVESRYVFVFALLVIIQIHDR